MIYQFRDGSRIKPGLDPQACGEFIASLSSFSPGDIVSASIPEEAPTHGHFSWDLSPDDALRQVWESEASHLIRAVVVFREDKPSSPPVPAFVSIIARESDGERSYVSTVTAISDDEYRQQIVSEARSAFLALRRRYSDLVELAAVFEAIDQLTLDQAVAA